MTNDRKAVGILASFLVFSNTENITRILQHFAKWLADLSVTHNYQSHIVIRVNNPQIDLTTLSEQVNALRLQLGATAADRLEVHVVEPGRNMGFGGGHNANFEMFKPDYIIILNDDLGFPGIEWLPNIVAKFDLDQNLAMVGESTNPREINPFFGNGQFPSTHRVQPLCYAEASLLFIRGSAFMAAGMFDESFEWAMCEDADLSFRMQQLGYRIEWTEMPHQHWRSASFNSLPAVVRYSIMEHNRARLFSKWGASLQTGKIGRWTVFDLYSDGIGDVFCALFHVNAELRILTQDLRPLCVINTNYPDMARLFLPDDVTITSEENKELLFDKFQNEGGVANVRTIRDVVYAHPFNIHTLLSAGLGVPQADDAITAEIFARFRTRSEPSKELMPSQPYYVVHLEFLREGHDGRAPSPDVCATILETATAKCGRVLVVGLQKQGLPQQLLKKRDVRDLRGSLKLPELIHLIANASGFIGIDSLPAHVAQLSGVPATIVFGSINPLARVWSESLVWPIVADLSCIGCYHEFIETSAPFCMRRDNACMHEIRNHSIAKAIDGMLQRDRFQWEKLRRAFHDRQRKFMHLMEYHPAPPSHFVRPKLPNENVSNLIYEITGRITAVYGEQLRNAVVDQVKLENAFLRQDIVSRDATIRQLEKITTERLIQEASRPQRNEIDLTILVERTLNGQMGRDNDWYVFDSTTTDPQIVLMPIKSSADELVISIAAAAEANTVLKIYWRYGDDPFREDRAASFNVGPDARTLLWTHGVQRNKWLQLRIDPTEATCKFRFKGRLEAGALQVRRDETGAPVLPKGPAASFIRRVFGHNISH